MIKTLRGDLLQMSEAGMFDFIAHGCNTQSTMGSGIAPQFAKKYGADTFPLEIKGADINKLGQIDMKWDEDYGHYVCNMYTQAFAGRSFGQGQTIPLDYEAIRLCFRKANHYLMEIITTIGFTDVFRVGLPWIGCGLAGGNIHNVMAIASEEFHKDIEVTFVEYSPNVEWFNEKNGLFNSSIKL